MNKNQLIAGGLALTLTAPFIGSVLAHPTAPPQEPPSRVALYASQQIAIGSSISAGSIAYDTVLGREISVAPRVDQKPRPAFIAPSPWDVI
jgi:hypothetical protein